MNANEPCSNISHHGSGEAVLDFYISKSEQELGASDADKNSTIEAFERLYRHWKNKRMILLNKVFERKVSNRPLPSCYEPHYTSEAKCKDFIFQISFHSYANKTNFHMKTFALRLAFIVRFTVAQKWSILTTASRK